MAQNNCFLKIQNWQTQLSIISCLPIRSGLIFIEKCQIFQCKTKCKKKINLSRASELQNLKKQCLFLLVWSSSQLVYEWKLSDSSFIYCWDYFPFVFMVKLTFLLNHWRKFQYLSLSDLFKVFTKIKHPSLNFHGKEQLETYFWRLKWSQW